VSFNRLQHILKPYGIELLLFGSCANGLALERSDVDIALSANILNYFPYGTIKERTAFAL
jgi:predicted nucleotidyltransferase